MLLLLQRTVILGLLTIVGGPFFLVLGQNADPVQDFAGEWELPGTPVSISIKRNHVVFHSKLGQGDIKWDNADFFVISYRSRSMACHYIMKLYSQNELSVVRAENLDPSECDLGEMRRARPSGGLDPAPETPARGGSHAATAGEGPFNVDKTATTVKPEGLISDCRECPEVVPLAGGSFAMGSPESEAGRRPEEGPLHKVAVKPFAMGRYAVTRKQYLRFVEETGYSPGKSCVVKIGGKFEDREGYSFLNPGFPQDDAHPVVCVNWYDGLAYVSWLSKKTGKSYRLPSEAEREYATRARTSTPYSFQDGISAAVANYDAGAAPVSATVEGTLPAAAFNANSFGLYQMHGNVAEWTQDCWNRSYDNSLPDGTAISTGECAKRAVRGGAWPYGAPNIRSAYREAGLAADRYSYVGFRVARELTQ